MVDASPSQPMAAQPSSQPKAPPGTEAANPCRAGWGPTGEPQSMQLLLGVCSVGLAWLGFIWFGFGFFLAWLGSSGFSKLYLAYHWLGSIYHDSTMIPVNF